MILLAGQTAVVGLGTFIIAQRRKISANLLVVLASLFCSLLLAEVLLQLFYKPDALTAGFKSYVSKFEQNQLGFRGQPIEYSPDDFVIVLLGDSFVQAQACAYEWMPERRLEQHLKSFAKNVRVFTVGASGYGQDQQLLAIREFYEKYRADLVILWQTFSNDVWNNMFPTHWPTNGPAKPTFWLENGELRGPTEQMGERLAPSSSIQIIVLLQKLLGVRANRDKQWEKYLPRPYQPETQYTGPVKYDWQERWNNNFGGMRQENLENEKSHKAILLTPRSERMQYGLDLTRKLLHEIRALVTSHNGKFVIFSDAPPWENANSDQEVYLLNGKYYRTSKKQFDSNVDYINREFQFFLIPVTVENWQVGPENRHLNEHATDQVMKDLALAMRDIVRAR